MASTNLVKNDYIIEKVTSVIYFIVKKDFSNIMLRREYDDELIHYPIHFVNSYFEKIENLEVAMALYAEENTPTPMENRPKTNPISMAAKKIKNIGRAITGDLK